MTDKDSNLIAGSPMCLKEWQEFARLDDCLDKMVPSDLRQILALLEAKQWQPIEMKDKEPEIGFKFVAFFDDLSGSEIAMRHDQGYIDTNGDDTLPKYWGSWIRLPDDFPLWFERNEID